MTIANVIENVHAVVNDDLYGNNVLKRWILKIENDIRNNVLNKTELNIDDINENTELTIKSSHEDLYEMYVIAMIHKSNQDIDLYNNAITEFNSIYDDYAKWYRRNNFTETPEITGAVI